MTADTRTDCDNEWKKSLEAVRELVDRCDSEAQPTPESINVSEPIMIVSDTAETAITTHAALAESSSQLIENLMAQISVPAAYEDREWELCA